jgi:hypothetical protein
MTDYVAMTQAHGRGDRRRRAAYVGFAHMTALRGLYPEAPLSLALVVAALIASLGTLAFIAAIFRQ